VAEHKFNREHNIMLCETKILSKPQYMDCIIRELLEIEQHPCNMDGDDGLILSRSQKPHILFLRKQKKPSHDDTTVELGATN
jgi:hypothetical protein